MKKVKIVWDVIRKTYIVIVGGNPYFQVFDGELVDCEVILAAFVKVGYVDYTDNLKCVMKME